MNFFIAYGEDAYEINVNGDAAIVQIIRYRHMRNGTGTIVSYEDLPYPLQKQITSRLMNLINNPKNGFYNSEDCL